LLSPDSDLIDLPAYHVSTSDVITVSTGYYGNWNEMQTPNDTNMLACGMKTAFVDTGTADLDYGINPGILEVKLLYCDKRAGKWGSNQWEQSIASGVDVDLTPWIDGWEMPWDTDYTMCPENSFVTAAKPRM